MAKTHDIVEEKITRFDGGIVNDPRDERGNVCRVVTNFDVLTNKRKLTPYRDSESGDSAPTTSQKQNFCVALRSGTTYKLFGLGVVSGTAKAEVLMKDLSIGSSATDFDDAGWDTPNNNQSSAGTTNFELFVYYKRTGLIYGARAGTQIWAFDPSSVAAWADSHQALTYTNIAQGLVHSKDDILYIPYDNKIAKNNNGSWTVAALTLPEYLVITSICEHGNYLAIGTEPLSGRGRSVVYLWDRDASLTTLSESIDWGEGELKVLEELEGELIGISRISILGTATQGLRPILSFKRYVGGSAQEFLKIVDEGTSSTPLPIAKQKANNRLLFMASIKLNGATRDGVWSIGRTLNGQWALVHERTPNNDTAVQTLINFFFINGFFFISYTASSVNALSKTKATESYTATSIYESKKFNGDDSSLKKKLIGVTVFTEPLPASGQVVLKYKKDAETSFTTISTEATDDSISHSAVNIESPAGTLPEFKEIEFRIESTGGAEITGFSFKYEVIGARAYD